VLRIRDVYPGSGFFSIPDPGFNKKEEGKKFVVLPFLELFAVSEAGLNS
jgi:hypothetical protein